MSSISGDSQSRDQRLDALLAEIVEAAERGEALDPSPYLQKFPEFAEDVRSFIEDWREFQIDAAAIQQVADLDSLTDPLPRFVGKYKLLECIARGGMGVVYKARQLPANRTVAIKMLLHGRRSTAEQLRRFRAEAEAAAQLDHPGIVPIYEVGDHDGLPFFSMRYVAGENLADLVARGPLPALEAARLVREIAIALDYAHRRQVVHRDLKPSNVLLEHADGADAIGSSSTDVGNRGAVAKGTILNARRAVRPMPRITDFGLAKRLTTDEDCRNSRQYTHSGQVLGTPDYMSPEQVRGPSTAVGPAADIYSLGAILYCLLTGRPPFHAADPLDTFRQVCDDEPIPPSRLNRATPHDLETIALRCLEKLPERRFASASQLAEELERFLAGRPILTRPVGWFERVGRWTRRQPLVAILLIAVVSAVLIGAGSSAFFGLQASRRADDEIQRRRELERSLYRSQMIQADLEWQTNNVNRADLVLDACNPALRNWEWFFLKRRCHAERLECVGHSTPILHLAYSPDGQTFASAGADNSLRVWNANTGEQLIEWTCDSAVTSVDWSSDGALLAAGLEDGHLQVWEVVGSQRRLSILVHEGSVNFLAFRPHLPTSDVISLATCGEDGLVKLIDATNGTVLTQWNTPLRPVFCVAFSPDGAALAASGEGATIPIWDISSGQLRRELPMGSHATHRIAFVDGGTRLLCAQEDNSITTWDIENGVQTQSFEEHTAPVRALAVNRDGTRVASGGKDGAVMIWEADSGELVRSWKAHHLLVQAVAFRPHGLDVGSCGIDGTIRIWSLDSPDDVPRSRGHTGRVNEVAFSPNGELVASASKDGTIRLWDATSAAERVYCSGHNGMANGIAFERHGQWLVSVGEDGIVCSWDIRSGLLRETITQESSPLWSVDVHPDSRHLVFGGDQGVIIIWDLTLHREVRRISAHGDGVKCVRYSPDGLSIASCGEDQAVRIWNAKSGQLQFVLSGHAGPVWNVAFSHDGRLLASCGSDESAIVWNLATRQPMQTCVGHAGIVYSVSFSPDGSRLATAGFDQTVKIWDLSTGLDLLTLRGPQWSVNSVAFSPTGHTIASGSSDWRVQLWHSKGR